MRFITAIDLLITPQIQSAAASTGSRSTSKVRNDRSGFAHKSGQPQQLCHTPCLGNASPRIVRLVCVEDFRDLPQSSLSEMTAETIEPLLCLGNYLRTIRGIFDLRRKEWSGEPRPHCALVIGAVPAPYVAFVMRPISWVGRRERAQSVRGQQFALGGIQDRECPFWPRMLCLRLTAITWLGRNEASGPDSPTTS